MKGNIKSIERRMKSILKDLEKNNLVMLSIGDGCNLSIYDREDYNRGEIDQISGITDDKGETIAPLCDFYSQSIH